MQIKYLLDYRKQDSITGVGLWWEPGQVRNVSPEMAERLLGYSDTWGKAEEVAAEPANAEEIALKQEEKPVEEPLPVVDFHAMDKKALLNWAETKYNEKIDKRLAEETIRHKVISMFGKYAMEQG
jgi:hypothetical protein